jgi:hypothetical protein
MTERQKTYSKITSLDLIRQELVGLKIEMNSKIDLIINQINIIAPQKKKTISTKKFKNFSKYDWKRYLRF